MNKIFKVVWSKVKHCYVVVSEIAKNTTSGGARRCRMGKVSLAAAMAAAVLTGSFAMPNSAWAEDTEWHGNSYEAKVTLSAIPVYDAAGNQSGTTLGITLYRGDQNRTPGQNGYMTTTEAKNALGDLYNKDYAFKKISATAEAAFTETLNTTIINDIKAMITASSNITVTGDGSTNNPYVIKAKDTYNKEMNLKLENGNLVVSVTDTDGTNTNTESDSVSLADLRNAIDTNTVLKNPDSDDEPYTALELVKGSDNTGDNLVLTVKDTAGNVVSGSAEIGEYVSEKITNEAKNATYITNNDDIKVTIGQQITQNINNITSLTNTVNAGWVAQITNKETTVDVKTVTPQNNANYLNFIAGDNVTLENANGAIKINANLNNSSSQEIDLNAGENIKLETNANDNGSITIIADIVGEGYKAKWQKEQLATNTQDDSGQEVTGQVTYEGQLKKLRIGNKVYDVPVISVIENAGEGDPLLRALELDGKAYRVVSTDYRLVGSEVTGENGDISYTDAYQVTSDENGNNKVELNVYDNYSGVLANDKIVITGMAKQEEFKALKFGVIKTTTGTGEETVTTNKLGLVGLNDADFGSVAVTTAEGYDGIKDATITFGGENGFTLPVGSTVRANADDIDVGGGTDYLAKISVNGTPYKVLTMEDVNNSIQDNIDTINNLSVAGGENSAVDEAQHGWQITDSAQQGVVYKDTTLIPGNAKTTSSDPSTNTYEVKDTAGNVVTIDDVASAKYVNEKFEDISEDITNLNTRVGTVENKITQINQNIANAKVKVEAGSNITVAEDEIDGGGKKYTISAKDTVTTVNAGDNVTVGGGLDQESGNYVYTISATNTTNKDMEGTGWVAGDDGNPTDNLLIKVNDSDGKFVKETIQDVARASNLRKESDERKEADATLAQAIINNQQNVQNLNAGLNKLGNRMNKVGAGSAALAALHPMDFDPDDKLQFSAGVGHYGGENAAALGAFYRPTEKVMFSVAGTMGNGEDMVNAGVTFALDKPNNVSNSRVAMAREIQDLRQQVAALTMLVMQMASRDNAALAGVAMFPDVPENHWAYDYIEGLQKQGIIDGYPDGNFGGDRTMTRYEFAAMLYRALEKGFPVDSRLLNEFNAELGRIRVDRIKGADDDANKVERVRVNNYEDRDDYGSKIVMVSAGK